MTVFKAFLKVLNKKKGTVLLYSVILLIFGVFQFQSGDNRIDFEDTKPDVLIINNDNGALANNFVEFMSSKSNIKDISGEENIEDALFYRDLNIIFTIPENFSNDLINGKEPKIKVEKTGDYNASLAEMLAEKYLKTANIYLKNGFTCSELETKINETLSHEVNVTLNSKIDNNALSNATFYYNFLSYSMLAGAIYVICLVLSSFKSEGVAKRTSVSSMSPTKVNRSLLIGNTLFAIVLWLIYVIISGILVGKIIFSSYGLIYIINSFIFTICTVAIAFLISKLVKSPNAINGIVNVVALGSSFLCGAFVPMEWLPKGVLNIAHALPTYWYILSNEKLKSIEEINMTTLQPILINMLVLLGFTIFFIVITNIITKRQIKS